MHTGCLVGVNSSRFSGFATGTASVCWQRMILLMLFSSAQSVVLCHGLGF